MVEFGPAPIDFITELARLPNQIGQILIPRNQIAEIKKYITSHPILRPIQEEFIKVFEPIQGMFCITYKEQEIGSFFSASRATTITTNPLGELNLADAFEERRICLIPTYEIQTFRGFDGKIGGELHTHLPSLTIINNAPDVFASINAMNIDFLNYTASEV